MVPLMISNMAAGNISIQLGFKGKCTSVVTACATGTNCIGDALRAIQYGDADNYAGRRDRGAVSVRPGAGGIHQPDGSVPPVPIPCGPPFHLTGPERLRVPGRGRGGVVIPGGAGTREETGGAKIYAELCAIREPTGGRLSHHFSGGRRKRGGQGHDPCYGRRGRHPGGGGLHQRPRDQHPPQRSLRDPGHQGGFCEKQPGMWSSTPPSPMIGHLLGAAGGVEFITCVKTIQETGSSIRPMGD